MHTNISIYSSKTSYIWRRIKMCKKTLLSSIAVGAVVGRLVSLFNKETRDYVVDKGSQAKDKDNYYINHQNETVENLKSTVINVTSMIEYNKTGALNALDQVENTVGKVFKK